MGYDLKTDTSLQKKIIITALLFPMKLLHKKNRLIFISFFCVSDVHRMCVCLAQAAADKLLVDKSYFERTLAA